MQVEVGDFVAVYAEGYKGQVCEVTNICYPEGSDIRMLEINDSDYVSAETVELACKALT